jgi:hypothetical protein
MKWPQEGSRKIRTLLWHTRCSVTSIAHRQRHRQRQEGRSMQATTAVDRDELIPVADDGYPIGDVDLWLDLGGSD